MLRLLGLEEAAQEAAQLAASVERQRSLTRARRTSSQRATSGEPGSAVMLIMCCRSPVLDGKQGKRCHMPRPT